MDWRRVVGATLSLPQTAQNLPLRPSRATRSPRRAHASDQVPRQARRLPSGTAWSRRTEPGSMTRCKVCQVTHLWGASGIGTFRTVAQHLNERLRIRGGPRVRSF